MLIDEIRQHRAQIEALAKEHGAKNLRIFGSVARGQETGSSDVDILVSLPIGYDMFKQRVRLTDQLSQLLGRRVELIPEHELNRHIRQQIMQEAVHL
ncbi:MAG: nucleotidyltransferase [Wenzhouxiangella sp.]|nr:MAG: nucleotidyltransferase [Wenzhouxiangella sp.]